MTREEAIKTLKENYCAMCSYGSQHMDSCDIRSCDNKYAIKVLEQELQWIPVSERLPEKSGAYLAYIINPSDDECRYIMTCEFFVNDPYPWCPDDETASDNVVAWMPLPEEYKPESEE